MCFLLDRFQPDWKSLIDREPERTTVGLLESAIARLDARPAEFSAADMMRLEARAGAAIAALSARQRATREDVLARVGPRIIVEVAGGAEPLRVTRFDPINLLVLDGGEVIHPNYIAFTCPNGTIELTNPAHARGSFAGTVALTRAAGSHPLGDGIGMLTVVGVRGTPRVDRREGLLTLEADGVRMSLQGADVATEGDTVRISVPSRGRQSGIGRPAG